MKPHTLISFLSFLQFGEVCLSEEEKKKKYYYYGGKEKKADEAKKGAEEGLVPYSFGDIQRDFDRMMERFQKEFENFWEVPPRFRHRMRWKHGFPMMPFMGTKMPSVDLEDRGKEYHLAVEMPGFNKDEIEIELAEDSVAVHAQKTMSEEEKKKNYIRQERAAKSYYRRIPLPEKIKSEDAKANLSNGVLEITLPKKEPKETKKLPIT